MSLNFDLSEPASRPAGAPTSKPVSASTPTVSASASTPEVSAAASADEEAQAKTNEPKILSVSDVNKAVRATLENGFKVLWIKGEISNFKAHTSGHFYFALKDSKASVNAVMFRGFNQSLRFKPHDGLEVIVRGKITVYEPRGSYQVFCEMMEPVGAGALQLAFEQLKRKLEQEGLFKAERKRPLPLLPRHVAVVTSPTGAAIRDILNVLNRRFRGLRVTVVPALVQGDGAPASICAAIAMVQRLGDVDVMIVGRGGGSIEDLWGFNDERVARAIVACCVPVISAVGHEIDFTIADFVADLRAPTPSAAAELVCKNAAEISEQIRSHGVRLTRALVHKLQLERQRLHGFSKRLVDPKRRLQDLSLRCDELAQRLQNAMARKLERDRQLVALTLTRLPSPREILLRLKQQADMIRTRLEGHCLRGLEARQNRWARLTSLLDAVSPLKVVERGYSITRKQGTLVRSAAELRPGDRLEIAFARGKATAQVESVSLDE